VYRRNRSGNGCSDLRGQAIFGVCEDFRRNQRCLAEGVILFLENSRSPVLQPPYNQRQREREYPNRKSGSIRYVVETGSKAAQFWQDQTSLWSDSSTRIARVCLICVESEMNLKLHPSGFPLPCPRTNVPNRSPPRGLREPWLKSFLPAFGAKNRK